MSVCIPRRAFIATVTAFFAVAAAAASADPSKTAFSGTVVAARPTSIVVRSSTGIATYAVKNNLGTLLAAGMRASEDPITISGELARGAIATFATSQMKFVAANVAADTRTAEVLGGGSVALDWGLTKHASGKSLVFEGRLEGRSSGVWFTVATDPIGPH